MQDPYVPTEDPYQDDVMAGIQRGEQVYHVEAACWSCHPPYLSESEIQVLELLKACSTAFRENFRLLAALPIMPPDYRWDGVKISSTPKGCTARYCVDWLEVACRRTRGF